MNVQHSAAPLGTEIRDLDLAHAGISLPALQQLMGHSNIQTTMQYVQLAPRDIWREYARAVQNRTRLSLPAHV